MTAAKTLYAEKKSLHGYKPAQWQAIAEKIGGKVGTCSMVGQCWFKFETAAQARAALPKLAKLVDNAMTQTDYGTALHQRTYDRLVATKGAAAANKWLAAIGCSGKHVKTVA